MVAEGQSWTTAELLQRARAASAWLDDIDAAPGSPVAALMWSSPSALALVVAGALSGRPVAPLGPLLTAQEVTSSLDGLGSGVLGADEATDELAGAVAAQTGLRVARIPAFEPVGAVSPPSRSELGDVAVVLHTSGTSGRPTRVLWRQGPLGSRTLVNGGLLDVGPGDVYVTAKGVHHIGGLGLTLVALAAGAAVVPFPRFTTSHWRRLASLGPTHASVVPTMIEMLLDEGPLRLPSLRVLQYGGAPIHPSTLARLLDQEPDLDVVALYGQTEGSPIACLTAQDHRRAATGRADLLETAGRAAPGVELRIESPGGDGVGEVCARADHFSRIDGDGWLRTGDLGLVDGEGYLRLVGRMGDGIVRGGENVHPGEVERVLARHPAVKDVAVAGLPDRRLGQVVGAWVVPTDPASPPDPGELRRFAREHLAGFKVPEVWTTCVDLPRNANGKVARRRLAPG